MAFASNSPIKASAASFTKQSTKRYLTLGYVPMTDCAPLIAANELGLFERYGVNVQLSREAGWATVREKMRHGELDAAHAHASMLFELSCGLGVSATQCLTGLMLSHNGSSISLTNELWDLGVRDAKTLYDLIHSFKGKRVLRLAVVLNFSTQNYLLRQWLKSGGVDPDKDVEIVVVPPTQVHTCLTQGYIDGYCAGEPWGSIGTLEGVSWCAALTDEVVPMHPEKVLLVRQQFELEQHDAHIAMIAALIEAATYCDEPRNRRELASMLAQKRYFNLPEDALLNALTGPYQRGMGTPCSAENAIVFHRHQASEPSAAKAHWILDQMQDNGLLEQPIQLSTDQIGELFQMNLYLEAQRHKAVA
jgi:ABC-type nitrate/sulfonate/bicarbonate transport system substrate-binding protein